MAPGDGLAAAWRAGAAVRDVEFVQFHPTLLRVPDGFRRVGDRGVLVSEAVRGEGAWLLDAGRRPVMAGVHPLGDLAPRDVVSAALERADGRDGASHCLLDATGFGKERWQRQFPGILALCRVSGGSTRCASRSQCVRGALPLRRRGRRPRRAHESARVVRVGEVAATGVQGANRLASNSITEALVGGDRAGALLVGGPAWRSRRGVRRGGRPGPCLAAGVVADVRAAMDAGASVHRTEEGLTDALAALARAEASRGPLDAALDATNLHTVATLVATAALRRTESRGCHRRADHPEPSSDWSAASPGASATTAPSATGNRSASHLPADLREDAA